MSNFKVTINGVEQQGVYSPEECGDKTCQLLRMMGSVTVDYKRVDSSYEASTKKSTSKPQSFSDMVKKQRDKNIKKSSNREFDLMMTLGSLNYFLDAVRQMILNPEMFEEINKRISKTSGVNSLHDLEHLLDDWHDEIEDELETYR